MNRKRSQRIQKAEEQDEPQNAQSKRKEMQKGFSKDYTYHSHAYYNGEVKLSSERSYFAPYGRILSILKNPVNPVYFPFSLFFFVYFVSSWCPCSARAQEKPLTQAEAVTLALRQSPQAQVGAAVREVARLQAQRDRPVARPTFNAIVSGTAQGPRKDLPNSQYVILPEGAARLDLIVEQVIYRGGRGAARQRYQAEDALALEGYRKTLADVAQTARHAYLDVLRAEAGLQTARDGVAQAVRYQALVQKQIKAGVAKPVDATTARAQVAEATAGESQAQSGVDSARRALNLALGRRLNTATALDSPGTLPTVPVAPDEAVAFALQNRSELVTLELNLRLARAGVVLARSQSGPTVTARGQYSEQTPTVLYPEHYYAATLELRLPLFDGGKTRQDTQEAQAQVGRLEAEREQARRGIELEVTQAWQKMRDTAAQIEAAREQRRFREALTVVAEKAYEVGQGTAVAAQAAQSDLRAARQRELQATYDLYAAALDFAHAQGQDIKDADAVISKKP